MAENRKNPFDQKNFDGLRFLVRVLSFSEQTGCLKNLIQRKFERRSTENLCCQLSFTEPQANMRHG